MKFNLTLVIGTLLLTSVILLVHSTTDPEPEVKKNNDGDLGTEATKKSTPKVSLNEKSNTVGSNLETKQPDSLEKGKVSNDVKNDTVDKTKTVPSKDIKDKGAGNAQKDAKDKEVVDNIESKSKVDGNVETKNKVDEVSRSKDGLKEEKLSNIRKGSFRGEQCESDFKCAIGNSDKHGMVACLSVPGDESTEVSLIIQNKGKGLLDVNISAPDFVRLDKTEIQIQENDDQKVMVSIKDRSKPGKFITLKTSAGSCSLDFIDFIKHNPLTFPHMTVIRTPLVIFILVASLVAIGLIFAFVNYHRRRLANNGTNYQKLDAELQVSGGSKIDFDQKDGWNDNWSDDWGDDVEAPKTPSMPLTPSISSAGVSSRKFAKDAWKD